jgi:hypothetical protein
LILKSFVTWKLRRRSRPTKAMATPEVIITGG